MEAWAITLIVVLLLLAVAAVIWVVLTQKRSQQLRRRFGTEYDRTVEEFGSRRRAEADLQSRTKRVERLDIHPLTPPEHDRFASEWRATQATFVDDPGGAVTKAETLVQEVMNARGYPVGDFDQRASDISVDHSRVVENYRAAREISRVRQRGEATTELLRRAMIHYRALFDDLLDRFDQRQVAR